MNRDVAGSSEGRVEPDLCSLVRAVERDFAGLVWMLDCQLYVRSGEEICAIARARAAAEKGLQLSHRLSQLTATQLADRVTASPHYRGKP